MNRFKVKFDLDLSVANRKVHLVETITVKAYTLEEAIVVACSSEEFATKMKLCLSKKVG